MLKELAIILVVPALPAGAQWSAQQSGTNAEFRGLSVVSPTVVWASGTRGRVAHTTDGGATWTIDTVSGADSLDLRAIHARSATRAWTSSAGPAEQHQAKIFATTNGKEWHLQFATTDSGVFLDAMAFWDERHGIAMSDPVAGRLFLLATSDGGATWTRIPTRNAPPVLPGEAAFAASGTCIVVQGTSNVWIGTGGGARARVFRSNDRGRTWHVADTPLHAGNASSGIFSVAFSDAEHGVIAGGDYQKPKTPLDNVAVTRDGGKTWTLATGPLPSGYMSAVAYVPGTKSRSLVAVGLAGTAQSSDAGQSWTMIDTVPYNSVAFTSRDAGWAVGPRGRIARWKPATPVTRP
ncbi:MAG TPA: hypothetical protein VH277_02800 [Gemmatimonadaceae bacterium]|jgi:photosystem II stability/assembly factor-like uncharacterized protein|nr:hypothetical protein [Gemmatimonadaceae bacterium]